MVCTCVAAIICIPYTRSRILCDIAASTRLCCLFLASNITQLHHPRAFCFMTHHNHSLEETVSYTSLSVCNIHKYTICRLIITEGCYRLFTTSTSLNTWQPEQTYVVVGHPVDTKVKHLTKTTTKCHAWTWQHAIYAVNLINSIPLSSVMSPRCVSANFLQKLTNLRCSQIFSWKQQSYTAA